MDLTQKYATNMLAICSAMPQPAVDMLRDYAGAAVVSQPQRPDWTLGLPPSLMYYYNSPPHPHHHTQ